VIHPRVLTTSHESATKKGRAGWLDFLPSRSCADKSAIYVFTDGSSKGSYAAVIVDPSDPLASSEEHTEFREPTDTANMGAEWKGLLLGLEHAPRGTGIVLVSDLLWLGAWIVGARNAEHPETISGIARAKELVLERGLELRLVHHEGHQKDDSHFTRWNRRADELCKAKAKEAAKAAKEAAARRPAGDVGPQ
jgi:hypothetical protein